MANPRDRNRRDPVVRLSAFRVTIVINDSKKIAMISSTRMVLGIMEKAFSDGIPDARVIQLLDETLLEDFERDAGLSARSRRKALLWAEVAEDSDVDCILFTCSTLSPCIDSIRPFISVPVISIEEGAISHLLKSGARHIGLVATADSVLDSIEPLLRSKAALRGYDVVIDRVVRPDIWELTNRDPEAGNIAAVETIIGLADKFEAVLISQVSISGGWRLLPLELRERVFNMPILAVDVVRELLV